MFRMPSGIAGEVTRKENAVIEPNILGADMAFGSPGKLSNGKLVNIEAGDTAADVYGYLARPYPTQGGALGLTSDGKLTAGNACDVLRLGYLNVNLARGDAAKGGAVYLRVAAVTGKAVGDLETAAIAEETVALPATFMGPADANGITEIAVKL